ncbi:MAG: HAD family phosphatase [Firmicutes bacterium]|nr:HAD family phosphatase [[Eubacterium] siraeum]MCM1487122.1 HAD family phosphatase [Bacillota bacterium]
MIKAVLFDMDGTILDTERIHKTCWEQAMADMGIDFTPTTFYDLIGLNDLSTRNYFKKNYGFTDEQYDKMSRAAYTCSREYTTEKGIPVKAGFFELAEFLVKNGIKTAVVTSSLCSEAVHNFKRAYITVPFDAIIGGDSVTDGKPAPEPYEKAAAAVGIPKEECLAVEDSANGIRSAYAAGIRCVYIKDMVDIPDEVKALAEFKADSLDKVIGIIRETNRD